MRFPQSPPQVTPTLAASAFSNPKTLEYFKPTVNGRYYHWEKLRRLTPPKGLNHTQWWCVIHFARIQQGKIVPLRDKTNQQFWFGTPDPIPELLRFIDLGAGELVPMKEQITNADTRNSYVVRNLIEEAITSSQLEGASTTRLVAAQMLREQRAPRDTSERMIVNNYRTMERISELKELPLTPELVLELHRIVTEDTLDNPSASGRLRTAKERIQVVDQYGTVFHDPPPAKELPARIKNLCDFANQKLPEEGFVHPVLRAILLHFWLGYDHPFVDGNGRTARALFYWGMLRSGYWLAEFISISGVILKAPAEYQRAFVYTETDNNDLTYFVLHQLEVLKKSIDTLHDYVSSRVETVQQVEQKLRDIEHLNPRQRALLSHALRHPRHEYTIQGHQHTHRVVYQTARTDLLALEEHGLLVSKKSGKKLVFTPSTKLEQHRIKPKRAL